MQLWLRGILGAYLKPKSLYEKLVSRLISRPQCASFRSGVWSHNDVDDGNLSIYNPLDLGGYLAVSVGPLELNVLDGVPVV